MLIENELETIETLNYEELSYKELQQINENTQLTSFVSLSIFIILIFIISCKFFKFLLGM